MSNAPNTRTAHHRRSRSSRARRTRQHALAGAFGGAAAVLGIAFAVALSAGGGVDSRAAAPASTAAAGEVNAMGMPVIPTPGAAADTVSAGGVEVSGARWNLGPVPLNVAVRPTWTLRNTGASSVTLGEPVPEVREGCCPGPLTLGSRTLAPGASTTLTFELSMHPGMDGPHDLGVHVPVEAASGRDHLTLDVVGDFRD